MNFITYIVTLLTLATLDSVWLFSMGTNYKNWLSHLFAPFFNFTPAIIFYVLYAFGVMFFVISPAIKSGQNLIGVFLTGALLGLIAYAAYDLTNHATLRDWPMVVTIVDMAWGSILTGLASVIVISILNYFK